MKSISLRDVIASLISSVIVICVFLFILLTIMFIAVYIVIAAILTILGIIAYPFIGEFPNFDILGVSSVWELYSVSFKSVLSLFTDWTFYVLIAIVSILDLLIRKVRVRIVTSSMYGNGIILYFITSVILSFVFMFLPDFQFNGDTFKFALFITFTFFLAHFHLTLLLHYILKKSPAFLKTLKLKMKKYSVEDNDSEL